MSPRTRFSTIEHLSLRRTIDGPSKTKEILMKTSRLLMFAAVLLIGSLASAATAGPAGQSAAPSVGVAVAGSASPLCLANASKGAPSSNTPFLETSICGSCSDTICRGQTLGAICRSGNPFYRCQNVYGNFCAADGLSACLCWNRPLP
jgi:hypothetical protein